MSLPAFLLAIADKGMLWRGSKRYGLPPVNARWSLRRFLLLVVAFAAVGTALGGALSLLATGRLLGWAMWLLGLFAACEGIVLIGLTALCWNQRVSRLRTNPNLPLGLPPSRFRLGRWLLGLIYLALLGAVTPLAMVVTIENLYGQMAWKRERAQLVAQGERLTFREIVGPEVPAAENAGAAAVFAPFFDFAPGSHTLKAEATNAIARIKEALFIPSNHLREKPKRASNAPKRPEDMTEWSAAYRKMVASPTKADPSWAAKLRLPPPGDPARDVLAGLAMGDTVVAEICVAAARPRAQFPIDYNHGALEAFGVLDHLGNLKLVQLNLKLRCAAHLAAGETDAAFADATNAVNVAELLREEPLLISQLVRFAQGILAVRTLWEGLAEHRWTDAQLAAFQERLGRLDYMHGLILAFEGERIVSIMALDEAITGPPGSGHASGILRRVRMGLPLGWLRQNQVALARMYTSLLKALRAEVNDTSPARFPTSVVRAGAERFEHRSGSVFTVLAKLLIPALASAEAKAAKNQTTIQLAITACALERHRLAHSSYPETLDQLVPAFLPKLPLDPMTGQPFHYRRTGDGWFLLYSVGEDGKDDGGVLRAEKGGPFKDWPWPTPTQAEWGKLF